MKALWHGEMRAFKKGANRSARILEMIFATS
jgi:hypothetical protein